MTRTIKSAQEGFLEESLDFVEKVFTESEDAESGKLVRSLVKEIRSKRFYVPELDFVMVDENNCVIGLAIFSKFHLDGKYENQLLLLSPVAVKTELQRQHISKDLIEAGFEKEKAHMSMQAVEKYLFDRNHSLVKLLYPPFDKDTQSPGYIKGYVPGIRENGGQYTHAAVWAALGFFLCGEYEKGTEVLFAINPAERYQNPKIAEAYRIEPYVFAGDVYANPQHVGRGGWSFYTGSAAWYRKVALETLCGYTEEKDGFYLNPRLSDMFSSFKIRIGKKNTVYEISVSLAECSSLLLDGKTMECAEKHFFRFDGKEHEAVLKIKKDK
jgi:cellobiose phosphorylase